MSDNAFIKGIRANAAGRHFKVALPDAEDVRVLKAALVLRDQHIAQPSSSAPRPTSGNWRPTTP